jgi:hypothetical protein
LTPTRGRCTLDDREWAGLWAAVWKSVQEASNVVINSNDEDNAGSENTGEEDEDALDSAFDYWR